MYKTRMVLLVPSIYYSTSENRLAMAAPIRPLVGIGTLSGKTWWHHAL